MKGGIGRRMGRGEGVGDAKGERDCEGEVFERQLWGVHGVMWREEMFGRSLTNSHASWDRDRWREYLAHIHRHGENVCKFQTRRFRWWRCCRCS